MLQVNQLIGFGSGGAGAPIQFVGGAVANKVGDTSGTTTIALNSGLTGGIASAAANGDLVIAAFATGSTADRTLSITDGSSDYTLIATELYANDTYDTNLRVAYKFVSGDTATTFGTTGSTADAGAMAVYVFRNVDPTTPLDVAATTATATDTVAANPPAITPVTNGAVVVCVGAGGHSSFSLTFSSGDLFGFQTTIGNDTQRATLGIGYRDVWPGSSFDAAPFGLVGNTDTSTDSSAAVSIALRPASPSIPVPLPITFVGAATSTKLGATSGNTTIALNSGLTGGIASAVQDGDLVIAVFATASTSNRTLAITDGSSDYTLIATELYISDNYDTNLRVAYKFVSGDTATTFGPTGSTDDPGAMIVYVFRGVDQTTPLDVAATTATAGDEASPDPPAITPVTPQSVIVVVGATGHLDSFEVYEPAPLAGFTTIYSGDTYDVTLGIGYSDNWVSGAYDPAILVLDVDEGITLYSWAAMTIALRPA